MSEAKSYKKQEVSEDYVAEPMAMKYSTVAEDAGYSATALKQGHSFIGFRS